MNNPHRPAVALVMTLALCACTTPLGQPERPGEAGEAHLAARQAERVNAPAPDPKFECVQYRTSGEFPLVPPIAARSGTEGWIELGYNLAGTGVATNIVVLSAHPEGYFERNAIDGLKTWKFKSDAVASCRIVLTYGVYGVFSVASQSASKSP